MQGAPQRCRESDPNTAGEPSGERKSAYTAGCSASVGYAGRSGDPGGGPLCQAPRRDCADIWGLWKRSRHLLLHRGLAQPWHRLASGPTWGNLDHFGLPSPARNRSSSMSCRRRDGAAKVTPTPNVSASGPQGMGPDGAARRGGGKACRRRNERLPLPELPTLVRLKESRDPCVAHVSPGSAMAGSV